MLDFVPQKGATPFQAFAQAPLEIDNKALGYRIHFVLANFTANNLAVQYSGRARFEELPPSNNAEKRQWMLNRIEAYRGSMRHFFTALYNNTLKQEGFLAYQLPHFPSYDPKIGEERINRHEVRSANVLRPGELSFEKKLQFDGVLEVINTKKMEPAEYIDYRIALDPSLINADYRTMQIVAEPQNQRSLMTLNLPFVTVDSTGILDRPLGMNVYGYWSWERVGDLLPTDYAAPFLDPAALLVDDRREYYEEGAKALKAGDWQQALSIWQQGRESMELRGRSDPRIAFAYIETVTENNAVEHFETASETYLWGFSTNLVKKYEKELLQELEMLRPLLSDGQYQAWQKELRRGRQEVLLEMKQFWIEKDPTPTTAYNERLLEHWQRIAYARANYTKARSAPYGTDDRGLLYVKYGAPDRKRSVTLGLNENEMYRWLGGGSRPADDPYFQPRATPRGDDDQPATGTPADSLQIRAPYFQTEFGGRSESRADLRIEIGRFNYQPDCEVWAYNELSSTPPAIFIFGPKGGNGEFGLRNGIEEFIPNAAFQSTRIQSTGMLPGAMLQLMFYRELSAFDASFAQRYSEIEQLWQRADAAGKPSPDIANLRLYRTRFQSEDLSLAATALDKRDLSAYRKSLIPIRLLTTRARFLNEDNEPELLFISYAFPEQLSRFATAELLSVEPEFGHKLSFSLLVRNQDLEVVRRFSVEPLEHLDHTAVFRIPHDATQQHYSIAAEAFGNDAETELPGIGQEHFSALPPLSTDRGKLEISDLVVGVEPPETMDATKLPLPIVPSSRIWKVDNMQVYFEVYNLSTKDGAGSYSLACRVFKVERDGDKVKRQEMVASSFTFTTDGPRSQETFGLSVANLDRGEYELEVEIRDDQSGKKQTRVSPFTVQEL